MEKVSFSRDELEALFSDDSSFCGLDISRISSVFLAQITQMIKWRTKDTHQIMDEIRWLEGVGRKPRTKKEMLFKREPLKGLYKTHYTDTSFIAKNIGIHYGMDDGGNKRLEGLIQEAFDQNTSGFVDDQFVNHLATGMTSRAFQERASRSKLTGEWIVYQKYQGKNYYLTLATHSEGDENIYERVCICYEFDYHHLKHLLI